MHLRKALTVAVLAAGLLCLTATADATGSPIGSPVGYIAVNGSTATGTPAIDGIFKGGTASFAGSTYTCSGGTIAGTTKRGAYNGTTPAFSFTTANIVCNTPTGNAVTSINSGCSLPVTFNDSIVNDGLLDTGTGPKYYNVAGSADFPAGCVKVSALGGLCTANVVGTGISAQFNEAVKTVGGVSYQDLIYNGSGSLANQSGCLGLYTGTFTLNAVTFNIKVTGGSTTGIDFRVSP